MVTGDDKAGVYSVASRVGFSVFKHLAPIVCLALFLAPAAQAANHGWYWGIAAGVDRLSADSLISSTSRFDDSFVVLATVGAGFGTPWRIEGELGYRSDSPSYGGSWDEFSLLANILYDIPLADRFTVTLGAGAGGDRVSSGGVKFAYQLIAGAAWSFSEHTDLTLQYRRFSAGGPETGTVPYGDFNHQSVTVGLRFAF